MREKVGKSRNTVSKSRLAKAAGAEPAGQMRDEKLHAVVVRSTFASQNVQSTWCSEHFWKLRCRKSARRCGAKHFPSQNAQNTSASDHFWKLRCRKSARRCGAKHISKSKCTKHTTFGPLLEVAMSKKCTPLLRKAHFQVKMLKALLGVRTTFGGSDVEKVHAVVARSTFRSQNVKTTRGSDHFWRFRCRFASLHYTTLHYTPLHYTPLHYTTLHNTTTTTTQLHSTTLHYAKLHIPLHSTTLHYITLHYITLNDTAPQIDRQIDR